MDNNKEYIICMDRKQTAKRLTGWLLCGFEGHSWLEKLLKQLNDRIQYFETMTLVIMDKHLHTLKIWVFVLKSVIWKFPRIFQKKIKQRSMSNGANYD